MTKIGIFPGSFDPLTVGHEDIIQRALPLFDSLIIAIGSNSNKTYLYSPEERKVQIEKVFIHESKIRVEIYTGLTVNFCQKQNAQYILRGIRTSGDFEFERNIGLMNLDMAPEIESIYIISRPEYSALSSSVVRDIQKHGGDISKYIPKDLI
jgi:pantetheine-phosphate adenylyltransferase